MKWRIDAWNVIDGLAFASLRRPLNEDEFRQSVSQTVYIAPPYFQPETIANLSTALGATRGIFFQEGLFLDNGQEAAFESLNLVCETVRRAYIGGSGWDLNPDSNPEPPPLPDFPRSPRAENHLRSSTEAFANLMNLLEKQKFENPNKIFAQTIFEYGKLPNIQTELSNIAVECAKATVAQLTSDAPQKIQSLSAAARLLRLAKLFGDSDQLIQYLGRDDIDLWFRFDDNLPVTNQPDILFQVQIIQAHNQGRYPMWVRSLGDIMAVFLGDRKCILRSNQQDFIMLLLGAMLLSIHKNRTQGFTFLTARNLIREAIILDASSWLASELPYEGLSTEIEMILHEMLSQNIAPALKASRK